MAGNSSISELKIVLLVLGLISLHSLYFMKSETSTKADEFEIWKKDHMISYESDFENAYRRSIYYENKEKVIKHNQNGGHSYKIGINQFSAMTQTEFVEKHLNKVPVQIQKVNDADYQAPNAQDIDWRAKGAVGPVKNQGQCAAAYTFSATGSLEGLSKVADGVLRSFSEQQIIDCSRPYGSQGCAGGLPSNAFKFVKDHGICTTDQYPYKGTTGTCLKPDGSFKISGFTVINSCADLSAAIQKGPVAVTVDATNWASYRSGIFTNCATNLNHSPTLVGLVQQVWIVKNSWSTSWGENGYIRLGKGNTCGICMSAILPFK